MKTRIFTLIVSLFITTMAFADIVEIDGITYFLETSTATVTSPSTYFSSIVRYSGDIIIPSKVEYNGRGYTVTTIGNSAFDNSSITSIYIPETVKDIEYDAFKRSYSLTSVTIAGNKLSSIGNSAFSLCRSLTSITIPNSVTSIGDYAFYECTSLTSITIPNSVTSIGDYAFKSCNSLTSVTINANNIYFEPTRSQFEGCTSLTSIVWNVKNGSNPFNSIKSQITNVTFGSNVTSIPKSFCKNMSNLASITIPNSVTSIGDSAFQSCSTLTSISIPNSVTSIGIMAFRDCSSLTSITIPNSVTSIGNFAFYGCSSLTSITIPNNVTSINYGAFSKCSSLTSVTIGSKVTSINSNAFDDCTELANIVVDSKNTIYNSKNTCNAIILTSKNKLIKGGKNTIIPNNVTSIGAYAFSGSSLTSISIPNSVTSIEGSAFSGCSSLTSISIPNSVTSIGGGAFSGCSSLTSISIPNSVTSIEGWAFSEYSSLTSITIPNSVTSIRTYAFHKCSSLTSVTIPNSVTSIGIMAFAYCSSLTELVVEATNPPSLKSDGFYKVPKSIPVKVPCGSISAYQTQSSWKDFTNFIEVSPTLTINVNDASMGVATITKQNSCKNNIAQVEAKANAGYKFVCWSDGNTENPRKITVTENMTLTAEFAIKVEYTINLNCDASKGAVSGRGQYEKGTVISIKATPNKGYHFVKWSDGNKENPRTITVTEDINLTAEFAINQHQVTLKSNGNGSVTGSGTYDYGTKITIKAIANENYHFVRWSDGNTENPRTITVNENINLTAEFALDQYKVTLKSNGNGRITGSGTYDYGTEITIEAIADKGYHFVKWSDGNTENPRIIVVTENIELSATFELDETPVENVQITSANVYTRNGILHIEGTETDYYVLDMAGRLIYSGRDAQIQLPRGVYVVSVNGEVQKVVL